MGDVESHYANLLGEVFAWSVSTGGDPFERAAAWIEAHGLGDAEAYLDLGAGFGAHTLPLLRAGKRVTAVDMDPTLLGQLEGQLEGQPGGDLRADKERASLHRQDIGSFLAEAGDRRWPVILCLGDTLTHLEDRSAVRALLRGAWDHLTLGGRLALSYRDSTGFKAEGCARFIPVAADCRRTMHCLLEPLDDERLRVTDIVTELGDDGPRTRISDYTKVRVSPAMITAWAETLVFEVALSSVERGLVTQILRRLR